MPICSRCQSKHTVKNGRIHTGKQRYLCRSCGYPFVEHPSDRRIDQRTRNLVDRLLKERLSMAGTPRAAQVSEQWLQDYVNLTATHTPQVAQGEIVCLPSIVSVPSSTPMIGMPTRGFCLEAAPSRQQRQRANQLYRAL